MKSFGSLMLFDYFFQSLQSFFKIDNIIKNKVFSNLNPHLHTTPVKVLTSLNIIIQKKLITSNNPFSTWNNLNKSNLTVMFDDLVRFFCHREPEHLIFELDRPLWVGIAKNVVSVTDRLVIYVGYELLLKISI